MSRSSSARAILRWLGKPTTGLPPTEISALIWPSPGVRISSASTLHGISKPSWPRPRKRDLAMPSAPNIGTGGPTCARRGPCGVVNTPGIAAFSPSCLKRAQIVLRQVTRYSVSVPLPAISGPVPVTAQPFDAPANIRAAATSWSFSTPARAAATSGVIGFTAAASSSNPSTCAATKLRS